jgi:hypothetical protein
MPSSAPELATLRDIHLPEVVGWWPLAPGWYAVAVLIIIALAVILYALHRHHQNAYAKRQALRLLSGYQLQYQQSGDSNAICARISELLKRVALAYFPRERVAALQGEEWIQFLNHTGSGVEFNKTAYELLELPYQSKVTQHNLDLLFTQTQRWIKQRKKPCLN